jgi:hypothetical protein
LSIQWVSILKYGELSVASPVFTFGSVCRSTGKGIVAAVATCGSGAIRLPFTKTLARIMLDATAAMAARRKIGGALQLPISLEFAAKDKRISLDQITGNELCSH